MSTSILYHCFGVTGRGYRYINTRFEEGRTIFRVDQDPRSYECSRCGSHQVKKKGAVFRRFRTLSIGLRPTILEFPIRRVLCSDCDAIRQVRVQFADEGKGYTRRFERYILELLQHTTIKRVPAHVRMSWHTVKEIQKRYLSQKFSRPSARGAIPGQDYFRTVIKAGINETIIVSPARVIHRITTPLKETMGPPRFVASLFLGATHSDPGSPSRISPLSIPLCWLPEG